MLTMFDSTRLRATTVAILALSLVQLACGGGDGHGVTNPPGSTTGTLVVQLQPLGNGRDADGFNVALDGKAARTLTYDASLSYESLTPGNHTLRISGLAPQCSAPTDSITHTVKAGVTDTVPVAMTCLGGFSYEETTDANTTDIVYLTEDGRTIPLTSGPGLKLIDDWSPDGTRLAYSVYDNLRFHLYSVRADGTDTKTLTSGPNDEYSPHFSPDGTHIAYQQSGGAYVHIAIADADGGNAHALVDTSASSFDAGWSTDGARLYFVCGHFGRLYDLCTAALDGSDFRAIRYAAVEPLLTPCSPICAGTLDHVEVSADGKTLGFEYASNTVGAPSQRMWAAALDGTSALSLSGNTISFAGRWSPSGDRMLVHTSDGADHFALATVKSDGSSYRQIVTAADSIDSGAWSTDGMVIAYTDFKAMQIGAMNADGSNRHLLTAGSPAKYYPIWNPKARAVGALSADRVHTSSPHVEQLPELPRLRPEILRRSLHSRP
jgi:Tol biopolymer transport system component